MDDTTLIPNGEQESLSAAFSTIDNFSYASGLKLNDRKTEALWIGSNVGKNEKLLSEKKIFLNGQKIKPRSFRPSEKASKMEHYSLPGGMCC